MKENDKILLNLHRKGFIPGPYENFVQFVQRAKNTTELFKNNNPSINGLDVSNRLNKNYLHWPKILLADLFNISTENILFFFNNKKLSLFQAAVTWMITIKNTSTIPLIQIRKNFNNKKKTYLKIYKLKEIITHEAIHAARIAFDDPQIEEIFAYSSDTNLFRKTLGPIIRKSYEIYLFLFFLLLFQISSFFYPDKIFSFLFLLTSIGLIAIGLFRLIKVKLYIMRALKNLKKNFQCENISRFVLFRLTYKEIKYFAKTSQSKIKNYIIKNKDKSPRIRILWLVYFKQK